MIGGIASSAYGYGPGYGHAYPGYAEAMRRRPTMADTIPIRGADTPPRTTAAVTRRLYYGPRYRRVIRPASLTVVPMVAALSTIAGIATTGDQGSSELGLGSSAHAPSRVL